MITASGLTVQFGQKPLFEDISITFSKSNVYGLIGANGSGKSTFMKVLSGDLDPTSGNVSIQKDRRVSMLSQDQFAFEEKNIIDCVMMGHKKLWSIKQERDRIYALDKMTEEEGLRVSNLEIEFADMNGYSAESDAGELLLGLGISTEEQSLIMKNISPERKLKVLLAQSLFGDPDILLLDEPTNNLDLNNISWLEETLKNRDSMMIVISHDRHFLNNVCTHMVDLDYGKLQIYNGNYDHFMVESALSKTLLTNENSKKEAKIKELESFVRRFSANASKAKQATSRANQLKKIKLEEVKKSSRVYPFIQFNQNKKVYNSALEVDKLSKSFDNLDVIKRFSVNIESGERIAIIGNNGIGKTTLLRCFMNNLKIDSGKVIWNKNVNIGYFAQNHNEEFKYDISLIDWMAKWAQKDDDMQVIRGTLGRLLFSQDHINKSIKVLSGGEKRRMIFGKIILQKPNVIVLDEPTNHLDMESIESLNLALSRFEGTIVFSSHDREFISSLATRIIEIKNDKISDYSSNHELLRFQV
ncbi:MAG: ABC-F family ATPase [Candidatus Marinimicrobia bacterium]|nr:ABC-F family ATPase [Candidatus Neomarinimicrobiota bacterium]